MSILLYGGSFNPITNGHLLVARAAREQGDFERVIFVPCGDAPHRNDLAPFEDRLEMVKIAINGEPGFEFSRCEGDWAAEGKKSFTINTYIKLRDHFGYDTRWLIGSDTLPLLPTWYSYPTIQATMKFAVVDRPGMKPFPDKQHQPSAMRQFAREQGLDCEFFDGNYVASATEVRNRLKDGRSIRYLVTEGVQKYVEQKCLYKG